MSDNKEQHRAEFEAWERNNASNLERDESGQYLNPCVQSAWEGYQQGRAAQPVVLSDDMRDKVRDAIAETLGDAYDCTRVWSAWSYGTMGPDDFSLIWENEERLMEITDAALNAILAAKEQT